MCQGADRFKKAKVQTLKTEFETLSMRENEQLDDFYLKLNGIVTNIRALGEEMKESYVVKKLLRAVPSKFLQIVSTLEQFSDLEKVSVEEVVGSLKAHEERMRGSGKGELNDGQLMLTEEEWVKREQSEGKLLLTREEWLWKNKQRTGEGSLGYKGKGGRDKSHLKCYNRSGYGHFAADCKKPRRLREYKEESNMVKCDDDEPALLLAKCSNKGLMATQLNEDQVVPSQLCKVQNNSNIWYLDNGASSHMTGFNSKFVHLDERVNGEVSFGDGSTVRIEGKGAVTFECKSGEVRTLEGVYYIPTLRNNIISLGQLTEEGNRIAIKGELLWVYDTHDKLLMKVRKSPNRLYKILINTPKDLCLLSKQEEVSSLWHRRLGHVNYHVLSLMSKERMVDGMARIIQTEGICSGCLMSKQTRKKFPSKSHYQATEPLELVHGDLCGPILPETASGKRYFFLIVDDFSRYIWVYFLQNKSEALNAFKSFCTLVERGPTKKVRVFRTDRGGEYVSKEFNDYYEKTGIKRHFTAPYSPQ